ncbi:MAG: hypothetical protein AAB557_03510 [Patescibacteria group bacterium]
MSDTPLMNESGTPPSLKELAKPVPATPSSETTPPAEQTTPLTKANARDTLKNIADGPKDAIQPEKTDVNKPEQTAELGPDKEKLDSLLTQSAKLLLDAKDPRTVTVALARATSSTPLGTELRRDVAQMIGEYQGDQLPPAAREQLSKIQQELELLNLPKTDAARSEFARIIEEYAAKNPDKGITPDVIESIRTNKTNRADTLAAIMKTDTTLTAELMGQLKGDRTEAVPNVATPDGLVKAAGLDMTPENNVNAGEILRPKYTIPVKPPAQFSDLILPTVLGTSMTLMFVASLAGAGGQEGGGH